MKSENVIKVLQKGIDEGRPYTFSDQFDTGLIITSPCSVPEFLNTIYYTIYDYDENDNVIRGKEILCFIEGIKIILDEPLGKYICVLDLRPTQKLPKWFTKKDRMDEFNEVALEDVFV